VVGLIVVLWSVLLSMLRLWFVCFCCRLVFLLCLMSCGVWFIWGMLVVCMFWVVRSRCLYWLWCII